MKHHIEEHDLGLTHDIAVISRRRALRMLGAGLGVGATAIAAGCSSRSADPAQDSVASTTVAQAAPQETQGPYPGDGSNGPNVLIESGIVRHDITSSFGSYSGTAQGVPVTLSMTMQDLVKDGAAGTGMAVYVWQCDREGRYSLYSEGATEQNYLRGVQVADDNGRVTFQTIFPACYPGRWPHIHFEVFDSLETAVAGSDARLTSQIALPAETCSAVFDYDDGYAESIANIAQLSLDTDGVFGDGWDAELASVTGSPQTGMDVAITIGVADRESNIAQDTGFGRPGVPPPGGPAGPPPR